MAEIGDTVLGNIFNDSDGRTDNVGLDMYNHTIPLYHDMKFKIGGFVISMVIFILGVVGNSLTITAIHRHPSLHCPLFRFILSLCVADILLLVCATLPHLVDYFLIMDQWIFGRAGCSVFVFGQYLSINASGLCIFVICVERYINICYPKRYEWFRVKRANVVTIFLWTFVSGWCAPWLVLTTTVFIKYDDGSVIEECSYNMTFVAYQAMHVVDMLFFYFLPIIAMCVMYGFVAARLSKLPSDLPGKEDFRTQVLRMTVSISILFGLLWLPYRLVVIYNMYAGGRFFDPWALMIFQSFVYLNSAIKPIVYLIASKKFRNAFFTAVCVSTCWDRGENNTPRDDVEMSTAPKLETDSCAAQFVRL